MNSWIGVSALAGYIFFPLASRKWSAGDEMLRVRGGKSDDDTGLLHPSSPCYQSWLINSVSR